MIISENAKPSLKEFKELMRRMDEALNADAAARMVVSFSIIYTVCEPM